MKRLIATIWHTLGLVGLLTIAGAGWFLSQGISARDSAPGPVETAIARTARNMAVPGSIARTPNPEALTPDVVKSAMAHWADHCASCHAVDGSGNTPMGQGLYPRTPDMRQAETQKLSDGELFYIIEHGVKLTGMPGWSTGTPEGEADSWHLVHFIRKLPALTPEEIAEVDALVPLTEEAWKAREEERRFLEGDPLLKGELRLGPGDVEHVPPAGDPKAGSQ